VLCQRPTGRSNPIHLAAYYVAFELDSPFADGNGRKRPRLFLTFVFGSVPGGALYVLLSSPPLQYLINLF